jgi:hypothetical protein
MAATAKGYPVAGFERKSVTTGDRNAAGDPERAVLNRGNGDRKVWLDGLTVEFVGQSPRRAMLNHPDDLTSHRCSAGTRQHLVPVGGLVGTEARMFTYASDPLNGQTWAVVCLGLLRKRIRGSRLGAIEVGGQMAPITERFVRGLATPAQECG